MTLVNTVKGESTVPLKFNVFQGVVEATDPATVAVSIVPVGCSGGATDVIDGVSLTASGSGLCYIGTARAGGHFIQIWKTPKVSVAPTEAGFLAWSGRTGMDAEVPGSG